MLYKSVLIYLVGRWWLKNGTLTFTLFSPYQTESFCKGLRLVRTKQGNLYFSEFCPFAKIVCNIPEVHLGVASSDFTLVFF